MDLGRFISRVPLPENTPMPLNPSAGNVFPSKTRSTDPRSGKTRRHHVLESGLQKAVKAAVGKAGLTKPVGCHTFRHYAEFRIMPSRIAVCL